MWYEEVNRYQFDNPIYSKSTGHFTQLIWKTTTEVGCGFAVTSDNKIFGVSNYNPPGNYVGRFQNNILPKKVRPFK